jgi:hypothetical protein
MFSGHFHNDPKDGTAAMKRNQKIGFISHAVWNKLMIALSSRLQA